MKGAPRGAPGYPGNRARSVKYQGLLGRLAPLGCRVNLALWGLLVKPAHRGPAAQWVS